MENQNHYIKTDKNALLNEKAIVWVKKMNECLEVCMKTTGCSTHPYLKDTHTICQIHSPKDYAKLNAYFSDKDIIIK